MAFLYANDSGVIIAASAEELSHPPEGVTKVEIQEDQLPPSPESVDWTLYRMKDGSLVAKDHATDKELITRNAVHSAAKKFKGMSESDFMALPDVARWKMLFAMLQSRG